MSLIAVIVLLVLWGFAPGFALLRRVEWDPLETLCASIGLSMCLLFAWTWIGALAGFLTIAAALWTVIAVGSLAMSVSQIRVLFGHRSVRSAVGVWIGVAVWSLILQAVVRHYGGADWSGDWYEHYQRAVYLTLWPFDSAFLFLDRYLLPARPPLMNMVTAGLMTQVGTSFPVFQVVMTILNSLIVLPLMVLTRFFPGRGRTPVWIVGFLVALSPLYCQNVTYTWTRLFCGFFVVSGLVLYLRSWRAGDGGGMIGAFALLATGLLTHYSAGPYLVFLAVHYLVVVWRGRRHRFKELLVISVTGSVILGLWFVWSIDVYGLANTVGSNTSVTDAKQWTPGENAVKIIRNVERTVVPFVVHRGLKEDEARTDPRAAFRDTVFLLYQNNVIVAMGSLGWMVIVGLLFLGLRRGGHTREPPTAGFWAAGLSTVFVLGVAVHGAPGEWGLAHICLQPMVLMLVAFLADRWPSLPAAVKGLVIVGLGVDLVFGILLHFALLSTDIAPGLGTVTTFNWQIKQRVGLVFLGDQLASWRTVLLGSIAAGGLAGLVLLARSGRRPVKRRES